MGVLLAAPLLGAAGGIDAIRLVSALLLWPMIFFTVAFLLAADWGRMIVGGIFTLLLGVAASLPG